MVLVEWERFYYLRRTIYVIRLITAKSRFVTYNIARLISTLLAPHKALTMLYFKKIFPGTRTSTYSRIWIFFGWLTSNFLYESICAGMDV